MSLWLVLFFLAGGPQGASARMQQYLGLADATLRNPIQPAELEAALLSQEGVATVRAQFEASLVGSIVGAHETGRDVCWALGCE